MSQMSMELMKWRDKRVDEETRLCDVRSADVVDASWLRRGREENFLGAHSAHVGRNTCDVSLDWLI